MHEGKIVAIWIEKFMHQVYILVHPTQPHEINMLIQEW